MKRVSLQNKYPAEGLRVSFDFISQIPTGQTLTAAVVTAAVFSGMDGNPAAMISGAASIPADSFGVPGTIVNQNITGGVAGTIYTILCTATTSGGLSLMQQGFMAVVPTQP